jgi:hypothetical protein
LFVGTNPAVYVILLQKGKCFWMRVFGIQKEAKPQKEGDTKLN